MDHSLSPTIQNVAFEALGLDYVYIALRVEPEGLYNALSGVKALGFHGLNVTMPHKASVIRYLDELQEDASRIGAVNTVLNSGGRLLGYNTDGLGALQALRSKGVRLEGRKVLVLGAGGASRSIVYSLSKLPCKVSVLNRTPQKSEELVSDLSREAEAHLSWGRLDKEGLARELEDADILINATPVGMKPLASETPVEPSLLRPDLTVFDLVYDPPETRLLREARALGAKVVEGLEMLVWQGAASFEIWTGCKAPVELMMKAAREALSPRLRFEGGSRGSIGGERAGEEKPDVKNVSYPYGKTWYHGSPFKLKALRKGSTITQDLDLARVFSHKPTLVSISEGRVEHNGTMPGFLYRVAEDVGPKDAYPHPRSSMDYGKEWLTTRELRLTLLGSTEVVEGERLTEDEAAELRRKAPSRRRRRWGFHG